MNENNPYATPESDVVSGAPSEMVYMGFWIRVLASIIDNLILMAIILPVLFIWYGGGYFEDESIISGPVDVLLNYVFPMVAIILFWIYKSATPGKMILNAKIVDARTGGHPSTGQFIGRYLAYIISTLPLFLGFLWVAWDKRKQGWHDKLANTVVIHT
ncbi:MAG: RDD family protein [gamma proteobacterium symbiont of Bathyaustriella thionipta]|nr:RDD family protein [gamma proteobacterium symbiont of Bathyaustriella thionipta]